MPVAVVPVAQTRETRSGCRPAASAGYVTTDPDVLAGRVVDHTGRYRGHAQALVRPGSEAEVGAVLRACREAGACVTVQGGRTSLVAGTVPEHDDILPSARKFGQFADETLRILDKHRRLYPGYDQEHAGLVLLLTRRAAFQKAVALWREGRNAEARKAMAPWRNSGKKYQMFWWASFLPGGCFDAAARLYFALPAFLRR